ncbi:MAG TPA: hypothetical protein VF538_06660 [Pyrinomonadaceae bacterium]|jgi:hypothetical protein
MARRFITTLLSAALALSGAGRVAASPRDEGPAITAEEEREARALLEEFNGKFVETNDIGPLIKDYFVPDFSSRLSGGEQTFPLELIGWKDEAAPPDPEDLRRFYVAATNLLQVVFPLYAAAAKKCAEDEDREDAHEAGAAGEGECDDGHDPKWRKFLPPAAVEIVESDPLLREMWLGSDEADAASNDAGAQPTPQVDASAPSECAEGCAESADTEGRLVENAAELRHLAELFEALGKILREHLTAHPVEFGKAAEDEDSESKEAEFRKFDPKSVSISHDPRVLKREFYGYPEGTRLVCAGVGALHAELVRVDDGRLRILTIYLLTED